MPIGKFLELSQKTNRPGPYPVTDQLSVRPTTRGRRLKMADAERRIVVGQAQLNIAYSLSRVPIPPVPVLKDPTRRETPEGDVDAAKAADAEYEAARAAANTELERNIVAWKHDVAQWREDLESAQRAVDEHSSQVRQAEEDYDRAFFGASYDDLIEFFDDQDETLWNEFVVDVRKHWVPSQPDDGTCQECGRVDDEEAAGKEDSPSTG